MQSGNHKVEMRFWWNKQPLKKKKKSKMEVKGAGL